MKIIISPAKSLNFKAESPVQEFSKSVFLKEAEQLNAILKEKTPKQLATLMKISDKLADLNWQRNQEWKLPFTKQNAKQAVYAFTGDVYVGLDAATIPLNKIKDLQNKLRILSGQYGMLKPLDLMQPYRLEMGAKLAVEKHNNLYGFWGDKITDALNKELTKNDFLVNLASNEYFKVLKKQEIKVPIITPIFKDYKNDKLKIISFYAKKARGLMVRYIIDNDINTVDGLKNFNSQGYAFDVKLSTNKELVFTR